MKLFSSVWHGPLLPSLTRAFDRLCITAVQGYFPMWRSQKSIVCLPHPTCYNMCFVLTRVPGSEVKFWTRRPHCHNRCVRSRDWTCLLLRYHSRCVVPWTLGPPGPDAPSLTSQAAGAVSANNKAVCNVKFARVQEASP